MDFSIDQLKTALLSLIAFIVSVTVHEFGHAWMANRLGDDLPRSQGRLTLSPLAHIDIFGTVLMPLVAALAPAGFPLLAWGKPVMTNPTRFTKRLSPETSNVLVSLAGPGMNLVMAAVTALLMLITGRLGWLSADGADMAIEYGLVLNLRLMFFNLLPVPPLDGRSLVAWVLPARLQFINQFLQRYGNILFFILLLSGGLRIAMGPADRLTGFLVGALMRYVTV